MRKGSASKGKSISPQSR